MLCKVSKSQKFRFFLYLNHCNFQFSDKTTSKMKHHADTEYHLMLSGQFRWLKSIRILSPGNVVSSYLSGNFQVLLSCSPLLSNLYANSCSCRPGTNHDGFFCLGEPSKERQQIFVSHLKPSRKRFRNVCLWFPLSPIIF